MYFKGSNSKNIVNESIKRALNKEIQFTHKCVLIKWFAGENMFFFICVFVGTYTIRSTIWTLQTDAVKY